MTIEFTLPCGRGHSDQRPTADPKLLPSRPPRIARLLGLAHRLDEMVISGEVGGYNELARIGQVSPARLSQILTLLHLSPLIQETILFFSVIEAQVFPEHELRRIAREPNWSRQAVLFRRLLDG